MSKVKEAMKTYFEAYERFCIERTGKLPITSYDPDVTPPIVYVGECDEEEYIHWKAVEKAGAAQVSDAEIHPDLREFWNSYWFVEIVGVLPSEDDDEPYMFNLDGILPGLTDTGFETECYLQSGKPMKYIRIGSEELTENDVVAENATGAVWMRDHETGELQEKVADSISVFLQMLTDNLSLSADNEWED